MADQLTDAEVRYYLTEGNRKALPFDESRLWEFTKYYNQTQKSVTDIKNAIATWSSAAPFQTSSGTASSTNSITGGVPVLTAPPSPLITPTVQPSTGGVTANPTGTAPTPSVTPPSPIAPQVGSYTSTALQAANEAATKAAEQSIASLVAAPVAGATDRSRIYTMDYGTVGNSQGISLLGTNQMPSITSQQLNWNPNQLVAATGNFSPMQSSSYGAIPNYSAALAAQSVKDLGAIQTAQTAWDQTRTDPLTGAYTQGSSAVTQKGSLSQGANALDLGATATIRNPDGTLKEVYKVIASEAGLTPDKYASAVKLGFTNADGTLKPEYKAVAQVLTDEQIQRLLVDVTPTTSQLNSLSQVTGQTADLGNIPLASSILGSVSSQMLATIQSMGISELMIANVATGDLSSLGIASAVDRIVEVKETVQGQLAQMFADSPNGEVPAWARPAVDKVENLLATRGFSNSTVARDALYSAIITSATPIAQADAQVYQSARNITNQNQQQVALANAAQRANFDLTNLNNRQQTALANAAMYVDVAKLNFTVQQQNQLANAQTYADIAKMNLSNQQQVELVNAATRVDMTKFNLTQSQQALLANADKSFTLQQLDMNIDQQNKIFNATMYGDIAKLNLTNQQQTALMNAQTYNDLSKLNLSNQQQVELANLAANLDMEKLNAELNTRASQSNAEAARQEWISKLDASVKTELFNAAQVAQMDMANADRAQQVAITNAQNYLQMAMNNTNNEQQRLMAQRQNEVQALLSDQAAINMQKQFTATTEADFIKMREQLATQIELDTRARQDAISLANSRNALEASVQQATLNTQASVANQNLQMDLLKTQAELTQRNNEFNITNSVAIQKFNAELMAQVAMKDAELVTQANISAATLATQNRGYSFDYLASELTALSDYNKSIDYANINAMSQQLTSYYEAMAKIQDAVIVSGATLGAATVTADAKSGSDDLKTWASILQMGADALKGVGA